MNATTRIRFAVGLLLAGAAQPVFAEDGFAAQFSPVAVGEEAAASAEVVAVPAPDAAPVPATNAVPETIDVTTTAADEGTLAEFSSVPVGGEDAPAEATTNAPVDAAAAEKIAGDAPVAEPVDGAGNEYSFSEEAAAPSAQEAAWVDPAAAAAEAEAAAQRRAARRAHQGPYIGIAGGSDHVGIAGVDDGTSHGLLAGYRLSQMIAAELTHNSADYRVPAATVANCALTAQATALYLAARSEENFFLKGRVGVLTESIESAGGCGGFSSSDTGLSVGVGVGMRIGAAAVEFDYTLVEQDIYRLGWALMLNF